MIELNVATLAFMLVLVTCANRSLGHSRYYESTKKRFYESPKYYELIIMDYQYITAEGLQAMNYRLQGHKWGNSWELLSLQSRGLDVFRPFWIYRREPPPPSLFLFYFFV